MTVERITVWAIAVAAVFVSIFGYLAPPTPTAMLVVAALGVVVVLPIAFVFVGWLFAVVGERRAKSGDA